MYTDFLIVRLILVKGCFLLVLFYNTRQTHFLELGQQLNVFIYSVYL